MEATEIMINDWLRTKSGQTIRILSISDEECEVEDYSLLGEIGIDYVKLYDIEPIPLTEEMLSVNYFSEKTIAWELKKERLYTVAVSLTRKVGDIDTLANIYIRNHLTKIDMELSGLKIVYVHQLQHALRLCGFHDIADDFKLVR